MAVRIRLKRTGSKNKACYRVVVADARAQRDGRVIETLGYYDPRHNDEKIDTVRADYWVSCGAQPSETVADLIKRAKRKAVKTEEKVETAEVKPVKTEKKAVKTEEKVKTAEVKPVKTEKKAESKEEVNT